jgi:chaperone BCS1
MLESISAHFHDLWASLPDSLKNNQFLGGGLFLGIAAALLNVLRSWPGKILARLRQEFMLEVTITEKDEAFHWVKEWLSHQSCAKKTRNLEISLYQGVSIPSPVVLSPIGVVMEEKATSRRPRPRFILSPGLGTHLFFYRGRLVWLTRSKDGDSGDGAPKTQGDNFSKMFARETIHLRFFSRSRGIVAEMLNDVIDTVLPVEEPFVSTYLYRAYRGWQVVNKRKQKNTRNLILPEGVFEDMAEDVRAFRESRDWYERMGLAHRRGFMLHGSPGNGKTTAVIALASHLEMDVAILPVSAEAMDDNEINQAITNCPQNALLLLEDVDCVFKKRESTVDSKVTFSGLLNAIDGVISSDGTILFMTTNHLEKLDPALIRPGRCDRKILFTHATQEQARRMFTHFFPGTNGAGEEFAHLVKDRSLSMCRIQEHLVSHRGDYQQALEAARDPQAWEESGPPSDPLSVQSRMGAPMPAVPVAMPMAI